MNLNVPSWRTLIGMDAVLNISICLASVGLFLHGLNGGEPRFFYPKGHVIHVCREDCA